MGVRTKTKRPSKPQVTQTSAAWRADSSSPKAQLDPGHETHTGALCFWALASTWKRNFRCNTNYRRSQAHEILRCGFNPSRPGLCPERVPGTQGPRAASLLLRAQLLPPLTGLRLSDPTTCHLLPRGSQPLPTCHTHTRLTRALQGRGTDVLTPALLSDGLFHRCNPK